MKMKNREERITQLLNRVGSDNFEYYLEEHRDDIEKFINNLDFEGLKLYLVNDESIKASWNPKAYDYLNIIRELYVLSDKPGQKELDSVKVKEWPDVFNNRDDITEITINKNIQYINSYAFENCPNLKKATINSSAEIIRGFQNCPGLEYVDMKPGPTSIGYDAFANCSSLKTIDIPDTVKEINSGAFKDCSSLEQVGIPKSVEIIHYGAFSGCITLKEIKLPDNLKRLGKVCFKGCSSLIRLEIPDSCMEVGDGIVNDCTNLKELILPDNPNVEASFNTERKIRDFLGSYKGKVIYKGKTYEKAADLIKEIKNQEAQIRASRKEWVRITHNDRGLVVYRTKKDIRCNLVLNGFKSSSQAGVFFPSEEEAREFLERNSHDINGWVVNDRDIHKARLTMSDKTFVKVTSINGDVYIQEKYAATLGVPVNSQTTIPA